MHIRDPIHGAIEVSRDERDLIDSPYYQRLRLVKQLGFADLAFPGAVHTRYAHGLGAMAVATRLFDALRPKLALPPDDAERLRQTLRLAVLFHDLGHPPLSHATERIMPPRAALKLPAWLGAETGRQANHEDYTLALVLKSGLTELMERCMGSHGIASTHVASLIAGVRPPGPDAFTSAGVDHFPLLRQVVSSEMDADRMDYLLRDSFFTGVNYGKFDLDWIVQNIAVVEVGDVSSTADRQSRSAPPPGLTPDVARRSPVVRRHLALERRAVFAFEDFLLSRFHMFVSVYLHATSVGYEEMLGRHFEGPDAVYALPADVEAYVAHDDVTLVTALRASSCPWARRIVRREGYRAAYEAEPYDVVDHTAAAHEAITRAGIDSFVVESRGAITKYLAGGDFPLYVKERGRDVPIAEASPIFRRYGESARLSRVYVPPERYVEAKRVVEAALSE